MSNIDVVTVETYEALEALPQNTVLIDSDGDVVVIQDHATEWREDNEMFVATSGRVLRKQQKKDTPLKAFAVEDGYGLQVVALPAVVVNPGILGEFSAVAEDVTEADVDEPVSFEHPTVDAMVQALLSVPGIALDEPYEATITNDEVVGFYMEPCNVVAEKTDAQGTMRILENPRGHYYIASEDEVLTRAAFEAELQSGLEQVIAQAMGASV